MRLALLLLVSSAVCTSALRAQKTKDPLKNEISLGLEYAAPIGDFKERTYNYDGSTIRYNYGYGATVKYLHPINKTIGISGQTGFIWYHSNSTPGAASGNELSFVSMPLKLGVTFRHKSFFAEPQLGITRFYNSNIVYQNGATTYGLQVGDYIARRLVLSGNFERWNKGGFGASHLGIRLAYTLTPEKHKRDSTYHAYVRPQYDKTSVYWKRHKTFNTLGIVSAGVGPALLFAGMLTAVVNMNNAHRPGAGTYAWIFGSGIVVSASTIPWFILAHKNKQLARLP